MTNMFRKKDNPFDVGIIGGWTGPPMEFPVSPIDKKDGIPDSVGLCNICGGAATWRYRHHCRCCGALTCDPCSQKEYCGIIPGNGRQRFCTACKTTFPRCDTCKGKGKVGSWFCPSPCSPCDGHGQKKTRGSRRLFAPRYMTLYRDIPVLRRLSNEISKESNANTQSK